MLQYMDVLKLVDACLQARNHELDAKRNNIGGKDDPLDVFLCVSRLGCGTMTILSCWNMLKPWRLRSMEPFPLLMAETIRGRYHIHAESMAGCRSLGDKNYRHPQYMSRFFHSGELIAPCIRLMFMCLDAISAERLHTRSTSAAYTSAVVNSMQIKAIMCHVSMTVWCLSSLGKAAHYKS